ncbi:hypothetical protein [Arthrobacter sp. NPDC056727]|uniref:hypothetical protein n=1 Tax=Arthrobacter sp. NPDC056727 TaxID=3345927 RepID=UPI00366C665F
MAAPEGQSVLVVQDDFDGDVVLIYTEQDDFTYKFSREAPEFSGWPRVEDQDCRLSAAGAGLLVTCDGDAVAINP